MVGGCRYNIQIIYYEIAAIPKMALSKLDPSEPFILEISTIH